MNRMNWRQVFASLIVGILLAGICTAQDPVQCQLCTGQSGQHVLCPGLQQCPRFYRVTGGQGEGSGTSGTNCPSPATVVTTATADDTTAATTTTANATAVGSVPLATDGRQNATEASTTQIIPTTTTTTTNTVLSSSSDNITTNQPQPPSPSPSPSTTPITINTLCKICLENCRLCNGSDVNDCVECAEEHEMVDTEGTMVRRCVRKKGDDSGLSIFIIAGAGGGGGALLLVVVVVVACVCCRRCRRGSVKRNEEEGPGVGLTEMSPSSVEQPTSGKGESSKAGEVQWRPTKPGDVPDYVNVTSTRPRPISIERGHDKVTRYVRDPTVKMATGLEQNPEAALPPTEEQELAELPTAPLPPPGGLGNKKKPPPGSGDPSSTNHYPPTRSRTTLPADPTLPGERQRHAGPAKASTLPSPSSSAAPFASDPHPLPKFPIEEELERQTPVKKPPVVVAPAGGRGGGGEAEEEPEEDYQNLGAKAKLHAAAHDADRRPAGVHNPGLEVGEEEPEDDYVNQSAAQQAVLDIDQNPYQNVSSLLAHR